MEEMKEQVKSWEFHEALLAFLNKSLYLWQNMEEEKEKGGGKGQEHHQYLIKYQILQTWQHPEHQKFCIAITIFIDVYIDQQMYRRTAELITESPAAVNDNEMDNLL